MSDPSAVPRCSNCQQIHDGPLDFACPYVCASVVPAPLRAQELEIRQRLSLLGIRYEPNGWADDCQRLLSVIDLLRADALDAHPAQPPTDYTRLFLGTLRDYDWLEAPEVTLEQDDDVGFDWFRADGGTVSAHISATGRAGWAALIGSYKSTGCFQWPEWPSELETALRTFMVSSLPPSRVPMHCPGCGLDYTVPLALPVDVRADTNKGQ